MPSIESREIRGVTVKLAVLLLSQAVVITATIVGTYSSLKSAIILNRQISVDYNHNNDQQVQNLQAEDRIQQNEIRGMEQKWNAFLMQYASDHSPNNK